MPAAGDPDVAAYLALVRSSGRPSFQNLTVDEARQFYRSGRETVNLPQIPVGAVKDMEIAGRGGRIRLRHYRPAAEGGEAGPAILFLHGGGWVIGDLETHDSICRNLADRTGLQLFAVDYRLAPECRFPGAVEDALDAHGWLHQHALEFGIDPAQLVLAGDSAGGCLALVIGLSASALGRYRPAAQCLFYPVTDLRGITSSYAQVRDVPITAATMRWFAGHYFGEENCAYDWRASPLLADNLEELPPTFMTIAGRDPLRDEGLALVDRLREAGVHVEERFLPDQVHGYLTLGRLIREAAQSLSSAADWLAHALMLRREAPHSERHGRSE